MVRQAPHGHHDLGSLRKREVNAAIPLDILMTFSRRCRATGLVTYLMSSAAPMTAGVSAPWTSAAKTANYSKPSAIRLSPSRASPMPLSVSALHATPRGAGRTDKQLSARVSHEPGLPSLLALLTCNVHCLSLPPPSSIAETHHPDTKTSCFLSHIRQDKASKVLTFRREEDH